MARHYQASGRSDPGAVPLLFVASLLTGMAIGAVESFVSQWFNLLLIFPVVTGTLVGGVCCRIVDRKRIRAPMIAALVAIAGGLIGEATVHYGNYLRFRSEAVAGIEGEMRSAAELGDSEALAALQSDGAAAALDGYLEQKTGSSGFAGFVKLQAAQGTRIKKAGTSDKGIEVTGVGSYILWAIEFLIAALVAGFVAREHARRPFCERCGRWYDDEVLVAVGSGEKAAVNETIAALERSDFSALPAALGQPGEKAVSDIRLTRCSHCEEHDPVLKLQVTTNLKKKPSAALRYTTMLRPDERKAMIDAFAAHDAQALEKALG